MGLSELNEHMAEGLTAKAEHTGDGRGASWRMVFTIFWEFGRLLLRRRETGVLRVRRLEFVQPDGRWTGPYCSEWMTARAFHVRDAMSASHNGTPSHPDPDPEIFKANPGPLRHVCASPGSVALLRWFGWYLPRFMWQGGRIATYHIPLQSVAHRDERQIVYRQADAVLVKHFALRTRKNLIRRVFVANAGVAE